MKGQIGLANLERFRQKGWIRPGFLAGLALLLWLMPAGMGGSRWIPLTGWGEAWVDSYCLEALTKTTNIYQVVCALDSALSVARSAEVSAGAFGVGGSAAPAEALAPAHDTVRTLSDFLTASTLVLLVEKQSMGMLTQVCLKIIAFFGLLCLLGASLWPRPLPRLARAGRFLCGAGILLWLVLPLTALVASIVDARYVTPKYNAQIERVKAEAAKVFNLPVPGKNQSLAELAAQAAAGFSAEGGKGLLARVKGLFRHLRGAAANPNDLASLLMLLFSHIAVTVFVAPLVMILVLIGVCGIFLGRAKC